MVEPETNWTKLRDEILSLAESCHKAFGEKSKHTDWLHNGDVCRLLNISKRTLQHHYDLAVGLDNDDVADSDLEEAEEELRDAFFSYDDALFTSTGVELPFDILDEDYDEVDEDEEDEDDPHAGLDEDDEEQVSLFDEEDLEDFDFDEDD